MGGTTTLSMLLIVVVVIAISSSTNRDERPRNEVGDRAHSATRAAWTVIVVVKSAIVGNA